MIKFSCDKCGHKLGVKDDHSGKRGRCPKCRSVVLIPEKTILINLDCQECGEKISAPSTRAGKKGTRPKCKVALVVPAAHNLTLLDVREEDRIQDRPTSQPGISEEVLEQEREDESATDEDEPATDRNLPWFIDVFLYPTSAPGLTNLAIFTIIPFLVKIARMLLGAFGILWIIVKAAIGLYLCWYITECVRDSAKGGTRAPGFYRLFAGRTDVVFWLLLAYGVVFLPMGLLACVMFDSIRGLNPVVIIGSMLSTFFQYCGLVLLIAGIVLIFLVMTTMGGDQTQQESVSDQALGAVVYAFLLYGAFVVSHLLGLFYWRNQDKLNWEV